MGKIAQGAFGGVSGTVGNLVGSSWKGIDYFRIKADHHHDANTDKQISQRNRFKGVVGLANILRDVFINPIWKYKAVKMTPTNLFVKTNMQAFDQDGEIGDYSLLKMTVGSLPLPFGLNIKASEDPKQIDVSWKPGVKPLPKRENDKLILFIMMDGDMVIMDDLDAKRSDLEATIMVPYEPGMKIQIYAFFASPEDDAYSESYHSEVTLN
ncbi:hypothetical protein EYV94_08080 [Puteibacter caeruleilacunae]|nr:hypothetical protein EYV94_08080 [Puteibacter caeruleilacunae]